MQTRAAQEVYKLWPTKAVLVTSLQRGHTSRDKAQLSEITRNAIPVLNRQVRNVFDQRQALLWRHLHGHQVVALCAGPCCVTLLVSHDCICANLFWVTQQMFTAVFMHWQPLLCQFIL